MGVVAGFVLAGLILFGLIDNPEFLVPNILLMIGIFCYAWIFAD